MLKEKNSSVVPATPKKPEADGADEDEEGDGADPNALGQPCPSGSAIRSSHRDDFRTLTGNVAIS